MNNELYHHGILGQRWGVRRYQNEDGSLTAAGKVRYGNGNGNKSSILEKEAKTVNDTNVAVKSTSDLIKRSQTDKVSKSASEMTDAELREAVNRLNLEQQYTQLSSSKKKTGLEYVTSVLSVAGGALAAAGSVAKLVNEIRKLRGD